MMEDARLAQIAHLPREEQIEVLIEDLGIAAARLVEVMPADYAGYAAFQRLAEFAPEQAPPIYRRLYILPPCE